MQLLHRIWWCYQNAPNAGCRDVLWVEEYYDFTVGLVAFCSLGAVPVMIAVDEWKKRDSEYAYGVIAACGLAVFVSFVGFVLPTIK